MRYPEQGEEFVPDPYTRIGSPVFCAGTWGMFEGVVIGYVGQSGVVLRDQTGREKTVYGFSIPPESRQEKTEEESERESKYGYYRLVPVEQARKILDELQGRTGNGDV